MFSRLVGMFSGNVDKPPVQVKQAALAEGVKVIQAAPASKTDVPSVMRREAMLRRELDEQQNDALSALDLMSRFWLRNSATIRPCRFACCVMSTRPAWGC